jgi:predicted kinase
MRYTKAMEMKKNMRAYVMVGAPGSGKSTFALELAESENALVVSGDDIRAELYGDANVQGNWVEIHDRIEELVSEACGMDIVLDGTHYRASYRKQAVAMLKSYGYDKIEAVVVNPTVETCLKRNASRLRKVPEHVIRTMHQKLNASLKNIHDEPFDRINFIL